MIKTLLLILVTIMLCNCSKPKNEIVNFFTYAYDIDIPVIDYMESAEQFHFLTDSSGEEYITMFNHISKVFYYYSLDTKLLKKKDTLQFLRSSAHIQFTVISLDSLIAFDPSQKIYFSYNSSTNELQTFKVSVTGLDSEKNLFTFGFAVNNGYVVLPPWKYKKQGVENYIDCIVNKVVKDSSSTIMYIGNPMYLKAPNAMGGIHNVHFLKFIDVHRLLINYSDYENLLLCNLLTKKIDTVFAKSNYIDSIFRYDYENSSIEYSNSYFNIAPSYSNQLVYDETKKMLFRFAHHPNESKTADGRMIDFVDKQWSLIGLDSTMNVLGEQVFPMFTYNPILKIFISKRGLIVSNNNPNNPKDKKGVVSLSVFKRNY